MLRKNKKSSIKFHQTQLLCNIIVIIAKKCAFFGLQGRLSTCEKLNLKSKRKSMISKISAANSIFKSNINFTSNIQEEKKEAPIFKKRTAPAPIGNVYGFKINKHYNSSLEEIFAYATKGKNFKPDVFTQEHTWHGYDHPEKRWVAGVEPKEVLKRDISDAINSNLTLAYGDFVPNRLPNFISTPNYGDNWGRHADYIEINNRALATMENNRTTGSMLGAIKLLPMIPPSHDNSATCLLISQLYPNIWGDGWNNNGENSLYGIKFDNYRLADNIGWVDIGGKTFTPEEQVRAFNDLAHLRGFKTSFRMLISEDQLKLGDWGQFRWNNPDNVEDFINACCKGVELGFDGIFFDSAKHVGGYDWGNYAGVGAVPSYEQMAYILNEVRARTGRNDLSFSGEKTENDSMRYKNMGFNAGTSGVNARNEYDVKRSAGSQTWCREFAWGPTVSDDNDVGAMTYEERLERINGSLFGYNSRNDKLPSFMQMQDLFPLNYSTNTHELMLQNENFSSDGTPNSHFDNLFASNEVDKDYRKKVCEKFVHSYNYNPQ